MTESPYQVNESQGTLHPEQLSASYPPEEYGGNYMATLGKLEHEKIMDAFMTEASETGAYLGFTPGEMLDVMEEYDENLWGSEKPVRLNLEQMEDCSWVISEGIDGETVYFPEENALKTMLD